MCEFFNVILDKVKRDNDIHSAKNVIVLSQTYYTDNKSKKEYLYIKDDREVIPFIDDEISLLTTQKMISSFNLVEAGSFKLDIEEEKTKTKKISMKIVADFKRQNLSSNTNNINEIKEEQEKEKIIEDINFVIISEDMTTITEEEIKSLNLLLDKHYNRLIFLQQLNNFRTTGKLLIPKKLSQIICKFFNVILDKVKRDNDIHSAKNVIVLSQTYYTDNKSKKEYLQESIIEHNLFKDNKFWEDFLEFEINKEIKKFKDRQVKLSQNNQNNNNRNEKKGKSKFLETMVFGQIMTISDIMIRFGLNKEQIYQIIDPKIKTHELSQEIVDNIKTVIDTRINDEKKSNE
jgi:hypothetical protein